MLDKLGLGPKREHTEQPDGTWRVSVTAPGRSTQTLILNTSQYARYWAWRRGDGLIQDMLPELSKDQREILMSGIGPEDWAHMFPPQEDE